MDKQRKKYLKQIGAKIVKDRSEKYKRAILLDTHNLSNFSKNYRRLRQLDKLLHNNRKIVYKKARIGIDFIVDEVNFDLSKGYLPIQGYYLQCKKCGDLVPMNPDIAIKCSCNSIIFDEKNGEVSFNNEDIKVVKLIALANTKRFINLFHKIFSIFKRCNNAYE